MTRRLAFEGPVWQVAVLGLVALCCAGLVGLGAAWGGFEYGRQTAPAPTALAARDYSEADLRAALSDCGVDEVTIDAGSMTIPHSKPGYMRECVLTWLEAPGPVMGAFKANSTILGQTKTTHWDNVTATWEQHGDGRDLTIALEET